MAYGRIIKPDLLVQVPMINVHFSHLPRWRGAAPVERAILAGDETTGVDIMVVEEGLDTGPLYARHQTDIGDHETAGELADRLVGLGVMLLAAISNGLDLLGSTEMDYWESAFQGALVLLADHELNASAFTVRCAASTGLNLYDAMIAGLVALKGPRHGGAGVLAAQLVKTLVDGDVAPVIRERVALGERFAGFGHGVYKHGDPRAHALLEALTRAGAAPKLTKEIPERIAEATGEFVNIDYALAVLVHTLGLPPGNELVLFAMARTVGWIAQWKEMIEDPQQKIGRPRQLYTGVARRDYVAIDQRK